MSAGIQFPADTSFLESLVVGRTNNALVGFRRKYMQGGPKVDGATLNPQLQQDNSMRFLLRTCSSTIACGEAHDNIYPYAVLPRKRQIV